VPARQKAIFASTEMLMEKKYFFVRLNPRRPTFPQDITTEERTIMMAHRAYWDKWQAQGKVVVFGPVADPKGTFGMGVVGVEGEDEIKAMMSGDPAQVLVSPEYFPMAAVLPK
jgi:uncharacterized protein